MKLKILRRIPLSKLLIVSYIELLIFVVVVRFIEIRQTRSAGNKLNTIANTMNQKLKLLSVIRNNNDSLQAFVNKSYFNATDGPKENEEIFPKRIASNDSSIAAYLRLAETTDEKKSFEELKKLNSDYFQMINTLLPRNAANQLKETQALSILAAELNTFENFQSLNYHLSNLVSDEADKKMSSTHQLILRIARRREIFTYVIMFFLLPLGLNIANALRKLSRTENKYRMIFRMSPLPTYFVDPGSLRIQEVNQATVDVYGYSKEEFSNLTMFDLHHASQAERAKLKNKFLNLSKLKNYGESKTKHYKKNGDEIDIELHTSTVNLYNKKAFLVIANDITRKVKMDRKITRIVTNTREEERRSLGAELHDNICQILAASQLYLDMAKRAPSNDNLIVEAKDLVATAIAEIRNLSHHLAPVFIEKEPLTTVINNLLIEMNPDKKYNIEFEYEKEILALELPYEPKLNLYRILQEQLKNIRNYANATFIRVELQLEDSFIRMHTYDDGVGFEQEKVKHGIGMISMKKRVESYSGKFSIDSSPGKGCTIVVEMPILNEVGAPPVNSI